jgi:hypothetical protein
MGKEFRMVRKHLARLVVALTAVTMVLGIAGAAIVVPASSAGATTSNSTYNFQCACNPYLSIVESDVAGLPLMGNISPELATVFSAVNTGVAALP